jgi:predicted DNA-binding protein (MmcQ/YjbR family)
MGDRERERSASEREVIERVRGICARLPEVSEEIDGFGHTAFRVGKRSFVLIGAGEDGRGSLSIKSDPATQEALVRHGGYRRTPYIGQHGWVSARDVAEVEWGEVEELLFEAYRLAAPKRLARQVEGP